MPDPLSINPRNDDILAAPVAGPVRMAMADVPPEVPPSGGMPPGKTKPGEFLRSMREPPAEQGGAPARQTGKQGKAKLWIRRGGEPSGQEIGTSTPTVVRAVTPSAIHDQVRTAFAKHAGTPAMDSVPLSVLRKELAGIPRADLDRVLLELKNKGQLQLITLDNPRDIKNIGDAALNVGMNSYHSVFIPP